MVIKCHLDESMPGAVARGLRTRGRDVTIPAEVELLSASDRGAPGVRRRERRLLVTADDDFLALAAEATEHAGIAYWCKKRHFGQLILVLDELCFQLTAEEACSRGFFLGAAAEVRLPRDENPRNHRRRHVDWRKSQLFPIRAFRRHATSGAFSVDFRIEWRSRFMGCEHSRGIEI